MSIQITKGMVVMNILDTARVRVNRAITGRDVRKMMMEVITVTIQILTMATRSIRTIITAVIMMMTLIKATKKIILILYLS